MFRTAGLKRRCGFGGGEKSGRLILAGAKVARDRYCGVKGDKDGEYGAT
jgi:hypothetical protein